MSKKIHTAQQYWDERSDLFGKYYLKPAVFDKLFRQGVYTRIAVATKVCKEFVNPAVLDIGSGPGVNSVTLLKNTTAIKVTGIDFSPNMIEYAKNIAKVGNVAHKCEFINADFLTYNWGEDTFDISIALGVFDYVNNAELFIKKISALTTIAFVISWPENGIRMLLRRYRYTCKVYHYTERIIRDLHNACDIKNVNYIKSKGGWVTVAYK